MRSDVESTGTFDRYVLLGGVAGVGDVDIEEER